MAISLFLLLPLLQSRAVMSHGRDVPYSLMMAESAFGKCSLKVLSERAL